MMTISASVLAATPSDYYCGDNTASDPVIFNSAKKTCPGTEGKTISIVETGICLENATCVFLTPELKDNVLADFNTGGDAPVKSFSELRKSDIEKYFATHTGLPYETTVLMCAGEPLQMGVKQTCPKPEKCKGDTLFNATVTDYNPTVSAEIKYNKANGILKIHPSEEPPTLKAN